MESFDRQQLEQKLNRSPKSPLFAHLAYLYLQEGEVERGLEICQSHILNHKKYGFGHYILGLCLHKTGNSEEAVNELEVATYLDPNLYEAWKLLKRIYEEQGDLEKAATAQNFTQVWEKSSVSRAAESDEFTVEEFIADADLEAADQDEMLDAVDFGEDEETEITEPLAETEIPAETQTAEESLDDFDLADLETDDALETTEELLEVQEQKAEETNTVDDIDGLDFDQELLGENGNTAAEEEPLEDFDLGSLDDLDSLEDSFEEGEGEEQDKGIEEEIMSDFSDLEGMDLDLGESLPEEADETSATAVEAPVEEPASELSADEPSIMEEDLSDLSDIPDLEDLSDLDSKEEPVIQEEPAEAPPAQPTEEPAAPVIDETELQASPVPETESVADSKTLTSTLGEIYISQGKFREALEVFEALLEQKPTNKRFKRKVNELKDLIESQEM